jgi:hypothetical protein
MHFYLYNGGQSENLNLTQLAQYLKNIFKRSKVQVRDNFITYYLSSFTSGEREKAIVNLAKEIAASKVRKITERNFAFEPLAGELEYEKKRLSQPDKKLFGVLYDGFKLIEIFSKLILAEEATLNHCHIIFTNQLFGTWDEEDLRYHARVSIYGFPSIISTTGIVEAPAKPREFYLKRSMGVNLTTLKEEFAGRFIDYDDPRLTEIMKGYTLQAVFYHLTGEAFCQDKKCRLFNAHWQAEVIQAQLESEYELCQRHQKLVDELPKLRRGNRSGVGE